ncbi:MFS transporter [Jiangella anatolica]|uniref:MFS transporter n=1 Tax=Jiangella anatolica TaxID=2670374 RepID=UPI0018F72E13|nr:MFS transporter [Jiangella anatolica]
MTTPARAAYAGFAAFGALWGVWGALLPAVREQAGLGHGQLGTALLFIGAGALPAMLLTGPAVDRWGHRVTALLQVGLGMTGIVVAVTGHGFVGLSAGLALLGAVSGAADVANNAAAASAEQASGRPVIARAHGVFSAAVVVASLAGGALRGAGAPVVVPFVLAAAAGGVAGLITLAASTAWTRGPGSVTATPAWGDRRPLPLLPLLVAGTLVALAFAVENAHQSWSAVYLGDVLSAGPPLAAAGPAVFAGAVALTRFATAGLTGRHALVVLVAGALTAAAGTAIVAAAGHVAVAVTGLGLAAAGTAVLQPTVFGLVARRVDEADRGRATGVVTTVAYLGFLAGPVYVGQWAGAVGLPGAMLAVAAVAVVLALSVPPAVRTIGGRQAPVRRCRAG